MSLAARIDETLQRLAAPFVKTLGLTVREVGDDTLVLAMPVTSEVVHAGGVLCGQSMLAAADTAMVLALSAQFGEYRPMTTVQLQTSFLRPVPGDAGEVLVRCRVLRRGRTLAFGEIDIETPDGRLAAHATTTYALL